jgi:ABC-type phosphate transport system permease subunit
MIRFLMRVAGLLVFAGSFIVLVSDGIRTIAADRVLLTPLSTTWTAVDPASLDLVRTGAEHYIGASLWNSVAGTVLAWPTFLVGGIAGLMLVYVGSRGRRVRV